MQDFSQFHGSAEILKMGLKNHQKDGVLIKPPSIQLDTTRATVYAEVKPEIDQPYRLEPSCESAQPVWIKVIHANSNCLPEAKEIPFRER